MVLTSRPARSHISIRHLENKKLAADPGRTFIRHHQHRGVELLGFPHPVPCGRSFVVSRAWAFLFFLFFVCDIFLYYDTIIERLLYSYSLESDMIYSNDTW